MLSLWMDSLLLRGVVIMIGRIYLSVRAILIAAEVLFVFTLLALEIFTCTERNFSIS